MKLPNGVTVVIGGRKFSGEIPDDMVDDDVKKIVAAGGKKYADGEAKTRAGEAAEKKAKADRREAEKAKAKAEAEAVEKAAAKADTAGKSDKG